MKEIDVTQLTIDESTPDNAGRGDSAGTDSNYSSEDWFNKDTIADPITTPTDSVQGTDQKLAEFNRRVDANKGDAKAKEEKIPDEIPSLANEIAHRNKTDTVRDDPKPRTSTEYNWKDRLSISLGRGLARSNVTNTYIGFNHRIVDNPVPVNREISSMVLITRPDFNFSENNIANSRKFADMLAQEKSSLDYMILAALDPDCIYTSMKEHEGGLGIPTHPSIPFDNLQAFIPMLTNHLLNFSGIPDGSVDSWLSEEGIEREQYGMVDSTHAVNYGYGVSTTLTNPVGDPMMRMADVWLEYMAGVKKGKFMPKIANSIQRRIDYQSRAYVLRFTPTGKLVRFSNVCAMWPENDNAGAMATFDRSKAMTADDSQVTLQWRAIGARHNDPLYMQGFNDTVAMFNPDMIQHPDSDDDNFYPVGYRYMRKLTNPELLMFNYYGYPHINIIGRSIEWWVYNRQYQEIMKKAGL